MLNASAQPVLEGHAKKAAGTKGRAKRADAELNHLREELADTRESLQAIIEEQEATNEELRSANEEIMSSNEELQSTNEELETAKEELQSTNEELTTLNEELEIRNTEMTHVNDDLYNILASVHIPMLILGRDLRIRRFTAAAEKLFSLIPADVGRPITDIVMKVELPDLPAMVMEVIDSLATRDLEARDRDGRFWSVRIRPYKTTDNKIDGAIVVLMDIDAMKTSLKQSDEGRAFSEAIVNTVREPLVVLGGNLVVKHVNDSFLRSFKVHREETVGQRIYDLGNGQWNIPKLRELLEEILPQDSQFRDFEVEHNFPRIGLKKMLLNARRLSLGDNKQPMILLAIEEVTKGAKA
jgi:two-component system CheB/CheR fusion protein